MAPKVSDLLIGVGLLASLHLHGCSSWQTILFVLGIGLRVVTGRALGATETDEEGAPAAALRVVAAGAHAAGNNPATGFGFTNSRGSLLHVRHSLPAGAEDDPACAAITAVVLLLHGLGAHANRKSYAALGAKLAQRGIAVVMYDQEGHGRSGGLVGFIPDAGLLVDDAALLVRLFTDGTEGGGGDEERLGLPAAVRRRLGSVPLFVMGQSMGGGLCVLLGQRLQQQQQQHQQDCEHRCRIWKHQHQQQQSNHFCGAVLTCPALVAVLPPAPVYYFLTWVVAPLFRKARMPPMFDATCSLSDIWVRAEDIARVEADSGPGGLACKGAMRFGTATALLAMLASIQVALPSVRFPFLVLHDPDDKVCRFEGTEGLMARSGTAPADKVLRRMPGMRHDLITNCTDELAEHTIAWLLARIAGESKKRA